MPLKEYLKQFTAIENEGKLYEFNRPPFVVTNAVPVFQRFIDNFSDQNKLERTYCHLDDGTISGGSKEEHDKSTKTFLFASEKERTTLNIDKCQFC